MDLKLVVDFLKKLNKNNNREWFMDNKPMYQEAHASFVELTASLIDQIGKFAPDISTLEPKKCVFRIYRDVRFSKDKSPYKTNFGTSMKPGGRKSPYGGYYIHIHPTESFVAGGIYHPESLNLSKIRQEIDYNPQVINKLISNKKFKDAFQEVKGDKLKRPPKGYDESHPDIELLKHKDFIVYSGLTVKEVLSNDFIKSAVGKFKLMKPFNDYFNTAIQD